MQEPQPLDAAEEHPRLRENYDRLIEATTALPPLPTVVVHPCDSSSLSATIAAAEAGIIAPTIVGPKAKIEDIAAENGIEVSPYSIVDVPHSHASADKGVDLIREGKGEILMKGSLHTDELMSAVVRSGTGLRTERRVSHVFAMDVPNYPKPLFITDAAINIRPNLATKRDIVQNAIDLTTRLGIENPRVAILSAVETVTESMPSTLDAAALCKMADRRQIVGGILDGPLALDNAISLEAAAVKGIESEVAGNADILVVPDLEAGNMLAKNLSFLAGASAAGLVLGARVPIILTSRADAFKAKMASCAVAALYAHALRTQPAQTK